MKKHAYLIMAHTQPDLLKKLLELIDDERNDIYLHMDSKAKDYPLEEVISVLRKSKCTFTERTDVKWGSYSQINCEMVLLKEAVKTEHSYYHLLSGMDLPIKSQDEIHAFFEKYEGLEFVDEDLPEISESALSRVKYSHKFYGKAGSIKDILGAFETKGQKLFGVNKTKAYDDIIFQKGRNWFSITHGLAKLTVDKESWIQKVFRTSVCGDELFLQTVARNSEFANQICNVNTMPEIPDTRYIDWERGSNNNPYVFKEEDYELLKAARALFARKFDLKVDKKIVEKICTALK
ncbi:MAG: glycosyl transferase [Lachnospiraceae bacterium]|nr:glycosyl transferase [Lachnospiraceae bacterium]